MSQLVLIYKIERVLAFSTATPLAANAVYTSPTVDVINYKAYTIRMISDIAGTYDVYQSDDGITWDKMVNGTTVANTPLFISTGQTAGQTVLRYLRIVYTNGATPQTIFRISSYLSPL